MTVHTHTNANRIVVVGGGLAGLAAATYLARGGASVALLEKAPTLGGRASTDTPHGFALNRGIHALYTGGAASEVLDELGVRYTSATPSRIAVHAQGRLYAFPGTPADLVRTRLLNAADKRELLRVLLRLSLLRAERVAQQTVRDWIAASARRPTVRSLLASIARVYLYSDTLDLASAEVFVSRFQQTLKHPVHYVDGGWQTLVDGLRQASVAAGVRIATSAPVAQLELRDGQIDAVRLHDGTLLPATAVLLALPPEDALRLVPPACLPHLERILAERVPVYTACLDLALERLPRPNAPVVFDLERPRFLTVQSEFARLAPRGGAVLHAFLQLDPRRPAEAARARLELEQFVEDIQPGWRECVVERHFLPHMLASSSLPLASRGGFSSRPLPQLARANTPNLYFAGDWVGPRGFLVDASLASARASARLILRQPAQRLPVAA